MYVIKIEGLVGGDGPTGYEGSYVQRFDFEGVAPGEAHLNTVAEPADAQHFADMESARQVWMTVDPRRPVRADGEPNRPLTCFSVSIEPWP